MPFFFSNLKYKMPPSYFRRYAPYASGLNRQRTRVGRKFKGRYAYSTKVGNKRIKALKRTRTGRIALSASLALKTLKKHEPAITTNSAWNTTGNAIDRVEVILPYNLTKSLNNSETMRECDNIYYFNCRGYVEVLPRPTNIMPIGIRTIKGWSKGNPDSTHPLSPVDGALSVNLTGLLATPDDKLDSDHYVVLQDSMVIYKPDQVYTVQEGFDDHTGVHHISNANWTRFKRYYNFQFNRKVMYDGNQGTDAVGNIPFIATILYHHIDQSVGFTGTTGANPSPRITQCEKAYFKDC